MYFQIIDLLYNTNGMTNLVGRITESSAKLKYKYYDTFS